MKKVLLLTKINPIEVYSIMMQLYRSELVDGHTIFFSPQYTAMLAAESLKVPFQNVFYSGLRTWEQLKEETMISHPEYKLWVVVGTDDEKNRNTYDAIISLNNPEIDDYKFDPEFNTTNIKVMTVEDGEIKFNNLDEVIVFLKYMQKNMEGSGDGIQ